MIVEVTEREALTIQVALGWYADKRSEESREADIGPELAKERRDDAKRANRLIDSFEAAV